MPLSAVDHTDPAIENLLEKFRLRDMMSTNVKLNRQRALIDTLDRQLLRLLNRRARLVREVASIKESTGLAVYDPQREQTVLNRVRNLNRGPLDQESVAMIFRCIMRVSRKLQEDSMAVLYKRTHFSKGASQW